MSRLFLDQLHTAAGRIWLWRLRGLMVCWEDSICDWCGSSGGEHLFTGLDLLTGLPGEFRVVRCPQCGLIRQNPRLAWESLQEYYPQDYEPYRPIIDQERSRITRMDRRYGMWKRLKSIERFQAGGRMLEIGCGTGVFLAEAARTGRWELMAVEPSQEAADYVRKELKIPVLAMRFSEADLPQESFDLITLWNVLEHFDHPVADIRRMASLLNKGGWLVFSIPNMESLDAKLFGQYWIGWDLPRHLYFFPQKQLKQILQESGLRLVDRQSIAGSHAALELSLQFLYRGKSIHNQVSSALLHAYHTMPARLATSLPFWFIDHLKLSSVITIFAQK